MIGNQLQSCSGSSIGCKINCIGDYSCGVSCSGGSGCGPTLNCPTTNKCQYCELYCYGNSACEGAIFNSYNCQLVNITFNGNDTIDKDMGESMIINAPGNGGSIIIDTIASTESTLKFAVINSSRELGAWYK